MTKTKPQPQRICSKCVKKIRTIYLFRNQCIESDDILTQFHKHIENQPIEKESNDFDFDMDEIVFPEQIGDKFLPVFDAEILKLESNMLDEIKRDLNRPPSPSPPPAVQQLQPMQPNSAPPSPPKASKPHTKASIPQQTKESAVEQRPRRKTKRPSHFDDIDTYVSQLFRKDIKANLKSLKKKYKKPKPEEIYTELCEQCGLTFSHVNEYKKHIRSHEDKCNVKLDTLPFYQFSLKFSLIYFFALQPIKRFDSSVDSVRRDSIINRHIIFT